MPDCSGLTRVLYRRVRRTVRGDIHKVGDRVYCAEELVAEIASAFLSAELGVTQDARADHAQYLAQWLELIKEDSRAIFTAAARASEVVAYLKNMQGAR